MNQDITSKLELFVQNVQGMSRKFRWHHGGTKRLAALLYTLEGKEVDYTAIRESFDLIKSKKGVFSMFRGNMAVFVAAMLSLNHGCEQKLEKVSVVYDMLKYVKFRPSDYLAVAAFLIVLDTEVENYQNTVERARAFYDGLKKNNRWHVGEDDYIFAVMLGLSDIDVHEGIDRVDELYRILLPDFKRAGRGSVQSLSQMLTLGGKSDEALEHLLFLRDALRNKRMRMDKAYTLPALGALSLLPVESESLLEDITKAQEYLRGQKGFSKFTICNQELLLFATSLVTSAHAKDMNDKVLAATSASIVNIIIAQQIAMIVAITAASSAAAAAG